MFTSLNQQMSEKQLKKTAFKNINDDFMDQWNAKVRADIVKEEAEKQARKQKQLEIQADQLKQIEEKQFKKYGMSKEEFDLNKELLKEVASNKDQLKKTIEMHKMNSSSKKMASPVYAVYELQGMT